MSDLLIHCCDYVYQLRIMEIIIFLGQAKESNEISVDLFPESEDLQSSFQQIKRNNFNQSVRNFLNTINDSNNKKIYSVKCDEVTMDNINVCSLKVQLHLICSL